MRFYLAVVVAALCFAFAAPLQARTYASIIVDGERGVVLHAVNPDKRAYPASLTKMMTLYLVFEALSADKLTLDQALPVSRRAARRPPSKLALKAGSTIAVRDAIGALVTKSANDVASVVAEALGGTEAGFARFMTVRARELGMTRTTFRNASGLPDGEQQTTARDMARLALAIRRDFPQYFHYFSMKRFTYRGRSFRNHNNLLRRYTGTDGVKTGYVRASGYNLAVSVKRHGRRLIGILLGGQTARKRDQTMMVLLNRVYKALADGESPPVEVAKAAPWRAPRAERPGRIGLAPVAPAPVAVAGEDGAWAIQVGAFERFEPAHLAASRAARLAPGLGAARISVQRFVSGRDRLYRAQLVGLSENRAEAACRTLTLKKVDCLVVQSDDLVAEGDR